MRALEENESLRLDGPGPLRVTCLFGILWITRPGDPIDHFLARGESLPIQYPRETLVSGFTPAVVSVQCGQQASAWRCVGERVRRLRGMLGTRRAASFR